MTALLWNCIINSSQVRRFCEKSNGGKRLSQLVHLPVEPIRIFVPLSFDIRWYLVFFYSLVNKKPDINLKIKAEHFTPDLIALIPYKLYGFIISMSYTQGSTSLKILPVPSTHRYQRFLNFGRYRPVPMGTRVQHMPTPGNSVHYCIICNNSTWWTCFLLSKWA